LSEGGEGLMGAKAFQAEGRWLRGNIHTHTTNSDGQLSPEEVARFYAKRGYDFLVLTDHWRVTHSPPSSPLLVISGAEVDFPTGRGGSVHLVLIGVEALPFDREASPKEAAGLARGEGAVVVLAHPYWSGLELADIEGLAFLLHGLEVFNFSCLRGAGRGESAVYWDGLAQRGMALWGFACDDAHFHYPDAFGGWVWVKAREESTEGVLRALREGLFYSSSGPRIEDLRVEGRRVYVRCSPAAMVKFVCQPGYGFVAFDPEGRGEIIEAEAELPEAKYVRVEVVDERGRKAWANPVFFEGEG